MVLALLSSWANIKWIRKIAAHAFTALNSSECKFNKQNSELKWCASSGFRTYSLIQFFFSISKLFIFASCSRWILAHVITLVCVRFLPVPFRRIFDAHCSPFQFISVVMTVLGHWNANLWQIATSAVVECVHSTANGICLHNIHLQCVGLVNHFRYIGCASHSLDIDFTSSHSICDSHDYLMPVIVLPLFSRL